MSSPLDDFHSVARHYINTITNGTRRPVVMVAYLDDGQIIPIPIPPAAGLGLKTRPDPTHSEDFHSVNWYGTVYSFSDTQAAVVALLWKAWENGSPEVGCSYLVENAVEEPEDADQFYRKPKLSDIFKGHPAWGTLIASTRKGNYFLSREAS
jgi:hypothetical protein